MWTRVFSFSLTHLLLMPVVVVALAQEWSLFHQRSGLVWDDCYSEKTLFPGKLSQCSIRCLVTEYCLGFNSFKDSCHLCMSNKTKSVSYMPPKSQISLYFRFDTVVQRQVGMLTNFYFVDLPNGLYDGQVLFFQTNPVNDNDMQILFVEKEPFFTAVKPECDLLIHVTFTNPTRPNSIVLSSFNKKEQSWTPSPFQIGVNEYLAVGMDTDTIVFVAHSTYTVFVNGELVHVFPRSQRIALHEVTFLYVTPNFPSVRLKRSPL